MLFWTFYSSKHPQCKVFSINSNMKYYWEANQYIRMISEGSCDTEDWSNDAENSALPSQE